jgi:hypothetical protein
MQGWTTSFVGEGVFVAFIDVEGFRNTKWRLLLMKEERIEYDVGLRCEDESEDLDPDADEWRNDIMAVENVPKEAIPKTVAVAEFEAMGEETLKLGILRAIGT